MSEQYIVSARKYRPQTFDTVVGQQHITTTLKNAIRTQHLAHAYLFCGPRGVGKTTCARILARTINCENPTPDMEACGECSTCLSFQDNTSFNIFELDAASNNSVDDIRSLTEQVRYAPQHGKYKIYIIDEVHMLSTAAFNAFLKTLEEPPSYAIFILATTEKHKILPTILSRCQIFDFKRIQTEDIVGHLASICTKEQVVAENAGLHIIAQKSEGCMRDALSMMDRIAGFTNGQLTYAQTVEHLNILDADVYFKLGDVLLSKDVGGALLQLDNVLQRGFEGDVILNGFAEHFRNLLLSKDGRMARLLDVPEDHKRIYFEKAQIIPADYILSALSLLNDAEMGFRTALNKRLHIELCLIRLCYLNDMLSPAASADADAKKKRLEPGNGISQQAPQPVPQPVAQPVPQPVAPPVTHTMAPPAPQPHPVMQPAPAPQPTAQPAYTPPPVPKPEAVVAEPAPPVYSGNVAAPIPDLARKPKLGRNFLQDIHTQIGQEVEDQGERMVLDQQNVEQLFQDFKSYVRNELNQVPVAEQLGMMSIHHISENEIKVVCVSTVNQIYGNNQREVFLDFAKKKTFIPDLRVMVQLDPTARKEVVIERPMNKLEIFEEMASKNPALRQLRESLNLQVE
ncbi:DNA polymerase III subunit gamma/tau [Taibaiella chishuiensis]|uniref:DNA polymerase III subunit gamma/tau n=1 Tax=Taibaiella chishuiensis TaxID=1434707 RepID=A0A2P8CYM5_9BACT|nr:DNA polymerase III subunit gamma/tau [Taibaiella chishuiensis]PSK90063.1 DNA polymerase-3 subunit gamma/tau [Taibaiella chishuiensis]